MCSHELKSRIASLDSLMFTTWDSCTPYPNRLGHNGAMSEWLPEADELARRGLYDPADPNAANRLDLVRYLMSLGATVGELEAATDLDDLALDLILRPRGSSTFREILESTDSDWSTALSLMAAVGLGTDPDELITVDEARAVQLLAGTSLKLLGDTATTQLARVTGNAMAWVAETLVGAFRLNIELPRLDAGTREVEALKAYAEIADRLLPEFVSTLEALLRRQIVAVTEQMWSTDEDRSAITLMRTVGFVDLVGYTTTTSTLSVRELTQVLMDFDRRTAEVVARGNGHIVKTIGDEAMFATEHADDACRIALELLDGSRDQLPPVRVGLATGEVVSVFGDMYGPNVNLAARLVAAADPGTAFVSGQVRDAVGNFKFELLPDLFLKGFPQPLVAYRLH